MTKRQYSPPTFAADGLPAGERLKCIGCGRMVIYQRGGGSVRIMHQAPECPEFQELTADLTLIAGKAPTTEIIISETDDDTPRGKA